MMCRRPLIVLSGYKFVPLNGLVTLREKLLVLCQTLELKGTILLSKEGANLQVSGTSAHIAIFKHSFKKISVFADMSFQETTADKPPFRRMKVKVKNEIITLRCPSIGPCLAKAPRISPEALKQWLDEKRDIILLDMRNCFEIEFGTFLGAAHLHLEHFSDLPKAALNIDKNRPIVTFCTGGVRCEKAALYLLEQSFSSVYQLAGGILNYFAKVGGAHYAGNCYVFDQRIALDSHLKTVGCYG